MSNNQSIVVTGASSMIGRSLIDYIDHKTNFFAIPICHQLLLPFSNRLHYVANLLDFSETLETFKLCKLANAVGCIHLAGYNGNINFNSKYPADIYYRTSQMNLNVLRACSELGYKKALSLIASCAYPPNDELKETELYNGPPHHTVEAHGLAKRVWLDYSRQLFKQHGFRSVGAVCNTVYGPFDSFDIDKTKVMGGLIAKFIYAKANNLSTVEVWGNPDVKREFIFVNDLPNKLIQIFETYSDCQEPINIGMTEDVSIGELSEIISTLVKYSGKIKFIPGIEGQNRKLLNNKKMLSLYPQWQYEFTNLVDGIKQTIEWYNEHIYV